MKWRIAGSAALLMVTLSHAVMAQQDFDPLSRLDQQSRKQIQSLIDSARAADLPWDKIRLKAIQGVNLKSFSSKRVVDVVREYYRTLAQAKAVLGPLATADEIDTGASVLAAKITTGDLAQFRITKAGRSPMLALTYLGDLIAMHNVPQEDAVQALAKLWKDGAADADFDALWRGIDHDILSGVNPKTALQNQVRSLPRSASKPPGE